LSVEKNLRKIFLINDGWKIRRFRFTIAYFYCIFYFNFLCVLSFFSVKEKVLALALHTSKVIRIEAGDKPKSVRRFYF